MSDGAGTSSVRAAGPLQAASVRADSLPLSALLQLALADLRELASAEIALVKTQAESLSIYALIALSVCTAALTLLTLALSAALAGVALVLGSGAAGALAVASATTVLATGIGVLLCVRALPSEWRGRSVPAGTKALPGASERTT